MEKIRVRIADGLKLRNPVTKRIYTEREFEVEKNSFWSRRITDCDVQLVEEKKVVEKTKNINKGEKK